MKKILSKYPIRVKAKIRFHGQGKAPCDIPQLKEDFLDH